MSPKATTRDHPPQCQFIVCVSQPLEVLEEGGGSTVIAIDIDLHWILGEIIILGFLSGGHVIYFMLGTLSQLVSMNNIIIISFKMDKTLAQLG